LLEVALRVCVYSFHPLVLAELIRAIENVDPTPVSHKLDSSHVADPKSLIVPKASVYVVEANARTHAAKVIVGEILSRQIEARLIVVAEGFDDTAAFSLLRRGVKGLLSYAELSRHLASAVDVVAGGSFWVPRTLVSRFLDSELGGAQRPRRAFVAPPLSHREREVYELLLENLSNKEIAKRLNVSERTAKFHVSNVLGKFQVKRRSDLLLLSFSESRSA